MEDGGGLRRVRVRVHVRALVSHGRFSESLSSNIYGGGLMKRRPGMDPSGVPVHQRR